MNFAYMYILQCNDGSLYTGSTIDIDRRLIEHQTGNGANYTKYRLPVRLVYLEQFRNIRDAFLREKQVQKWSKKKKRALIENRIDLLHKYAKCNNNTSSEKKVSE